MKKYGIVDSGDALTLGIGAMTDARWKDFFDKMVQTGIIDASTDYKKAYTLQVRQQGRRPRSPAEIARRRRAASNFLRAVSPVTDDGELSA